MELLVDLYSGLRDNPRAVLICIGFPVVLLLLFGGNGPGIGGGSGGDCGGGGDGGD
ncbi:hypothetical protein ABMC89_01450 [Sulfitobacter sp. HNIBRBA3233]|uniref:hypothetical protein n=1 Tax=Sulfitobacter marinivivus TaxID=3158558 RepID=UPI0032DEC038